MQKQLFTEAGTELRGKPVAVCCGVGVDSVALLVGLHARGIRPDLITFADTGGEKPETYLYVPLLQQWLRDVGFPQLTVCRLVPKIAKYRTLYENCEQNGTIPSLAFGRKSCSLRWKRDAQEPLRRRFPAFQQEWLDGRKIAKLIGFDASERRRTYAAVGAKDQDLYEMCYPLQEWGWDRERCQAEIAAVGLPVPIKSACFFCPAMKWLEVELLKKQHPDLYAKAIALEAGYINNPKHGPAARRARGENSSTAGLARRYAWRDRDPHLGTN